MTRETVCNFTAGNVIPITSLLEFEEKEQWYQSEIDRKDQEIMRLRIQLAQLQTDMEGVQKKFNQMEQKLEKVTEENKILLVRNNSAEAQILQLRRIIYGQSSESIDTAGQEELNTTALPEGTCNGEADENNEEIKMAEGEAGAETEIPPEHSDSHGKGKSKRTRANNGEKTLRPDNIRKQMNEKLPKVNVYPLSDELIRRLDRIYGKGKWMLMNWEPTSHLVHIPEMYLNRIDYVPVIRKDDGNLARPFSENPGEFPTYILPHAVVSSSEFANIIHKKFVLGIPLYRQEKEMLKMTGVHLGRQRMADWIIKAGTQGFVQVYEYLIRMEQACEYHSIDETFLQVLRDGRAAATKSYLWAHRTGELANPEHPVAVFMFELTRATEHLRKYFPEDIAAIISCDHYISYEVLEKERENVYTALCWMHVRRRFFFAFDLVANIKGISEQAVCESLEAKLLQKIGEIYRDEMKLKDLTPEERKIARTQNVRPLVEEFFAMLHGIDLEDASLTHVLRDAVSYALGGEEKLKRFLDDPRIPIDNGSAERIIRNVATGRRAWLFCDTENGAKALALFYSLVTTAQMNGANDYYYIKYLCEHVPGGIGEPLRKLSDDELEALMPWSEQYKAYEKHEIESRYEGIVFDMDMKHAPTNADIQRVRQEMETAETRNDQDADDGDSLIYSTDMNLDAGAGMIPDAVLNRQSVDLHPDIAHGTGPADENSLIEIQTSAKQPPAPPDCANGDSFVIPLPDETERKTG